MMGPDSAKFYHALLLLVGLISLIIFIVVREQSGLRTT